MYDTPLNGTPRIREDGYSKKNSPCGCGHSLSMPYGNCYLCAELDQNGNIIKRQIPYIMSASDETEDQYTSQSVFYQGYHSYRNPLDYTYRSKGQTGPMFLNVRIDGVASTINSFYSDASDINGEYTLMRAPYGDELSGFNSRDDRACYWFGYPCNKDKIYSSAGFNKLGVFMSSGVTNWWPVESFPPESPLNGISSGLMDIYLNCRLEFAKYDLGWNFGSNPNGFRASLCNQESGVFTALKRNSIIEKKVKVGTVVVSRSISSGPTEDQYINSDIRCYDWNDLELTSFSAYPQDYDDINEWQDGYPMDEDMFDVSNLKIYITSLPDGNNNRFDKFVHHSNNGNLNTNLINIDLPYYTYEYSEGFGTQTGYVFADTNQDVLNVGVYLGGDQEPHLKGETLRDIYNTNPMPLAYNVTISNLQNKNCTSCTGLNGQHILYLWGQDYYSLNTGDSSVGNGYQDSVLYGKHLYNKEVPLPSSLGYSGNLPCIYGIGCSGVIADNFGLTFTPAVSGGHIDFGIYNNKYNTRVRYRRTVNDLPLHTTLNYDGGFNQTFTPAFGLSAISGSVVDMCDWSSANIKVESYHDSSDYTTNCFAPCMECFSCKNGEMPSNITVNIGSWEYTYLSTTYDIAGTYILTKNGASSYTYNGSGFDINFTFGCGGENENPNRLNISMFSLDQEDCDPFSFNPSEFYYSLSSSPIGDYYSRLAYNTAQEILNTDFYDCSSIDESMIFHSRTPNDCPQTGPSVTITFNS